MSVVHADGRGLAGLTGELALAAEPYTTPSNRS